MNLLSLGRAFRRGWIWVVLILAAAIAAGVLITQSATPQYTVQSRILYSLSSQGSLQSQVQANSLAVQKAATDAQLVVTPTVLTPAIATLNDPSLTVDNVTPGVTAIAKETLLDITVVLPDADQAAALSQAIIDQLTTSAAASKIVVDPLDPATLTYTYTLAPIVPPVAPDTPSSPSLLINLLVAFAIGVLAAAIFLAVKASRDKRIYDLETLQSTTDLPIVGSLAVKEGNGTGAVPNPTGVATLREALQARNPKGGTWLVTSAGNVKAGGVGRALAASMAAIGRRTALLATDSGSGTAPGLSDYLAGKAESDAVLDTATVPGVVYVPAGTLSGEGADVLAHTETAAALGTLTKDTDIVFVTAAPADRSADASVLARMGLQTLVLVRRGRTTTPELSSALSALTEAGGAVTGIVFLTKS